MVATETRHQGASCRDSCVEFFFTPGADPEPGYFNIEMTCVGATLFHHQREPGVERVVMDDAALESLQLRHSLAGPVIDPERVGPQTCTVGYRVPFAILRNGAAEKAAPASPPVAGSVWRANFYKCADQSSHPHWLTWSSVEFERPNFHLKQQFGYLDFA